MFVLLIHHQIPTKTIHVNIYDNNFHTNTLLKWFYRKTILKSQLRRRTFMLMAGRLPNEKYNTKYYRICFHLIFRVCKYVSMDKSIYMYFQFFGKFLLGSHEHEICIVGNSMIMAAHCMFYFTAIEAKYSHLDTSIHVHVVLWLP